MTETEVARIERGEAVGLAELGLRLDEAKQLTAALQAPIVRWPWRASVVAGAWPVDEVWPARAIAPRCSAPCLATCRCACDGCLPALVRVRVRRRASPPWTSARMRSRLSLPTWRGAERRHGPEQDVAGRPGRCAAALHQECGAPCSAGGRPRRGWAGWRLRTQPAPAGAPLRGDRGQGHRRPGAQHRFAFARNGQAT